MPDQKEISTYRGELQRVIREAWKLYEAASPLRDVAIGAEKEFFNKFRGQMNDSILWLIRLDDSMSQERGNTPF
jgi:hypothetical protein